MAPGRVGDAEPSQRRPLPLTGGNRPFDYSPKLDEEVDCARCHAAGRMDPFETGLQRIQGVVEFSQNFIVRAAG